MRNRENNYKKDNGIYQKSLIDDKEYDERDQISKFDEEKMIEDIEVLELEKMS